MSATGTKATSVINHGDIVERHEEYYFIVTLEHPGFPSTNGRNGYQWKVAKEDVAPSKGSTLQVQMQVFAWVEEMSVFAWRFKIPKCREK